MKIDIDAARCQVVQNSRPCNTEHLIYTIQYNKHIFLKNMFLHIIFYLTFHICLFLTASAINFPVEWVVFENIHFLLPSGHIFWYINGGLMYINKICVLDNINLDKIVQNY